ncbi:hypothetical protein [Undibacterium sp. RuTC16W]|uniref:hypothetical protein n=1 Tax=Undibacterium sp. RuTC16W TaxID=3413048 RepID=UPI003BF0C1EC
MDNYEKKRKSDEDARNADEAKKERIQVETENRDQIITMGNTCAESIKKYRGQTWTEYARNAGTYEKHNFGLGLEPAVICFGCRRKLPPNLITGDHIAPQSNKTRLREVIAFAKGPADHFNSQIYLEAIEMKKALVRDDGDLLNAINAIRFYDETLNKDLRNIQPLCWSCNARKGDRDNVKLFPDNLEPKRPHEAPF